MYVHSVEVESYVTYYRWSFFAPLYSRFVVYDIPQKSAFGFMTQNRVFNEIHNTYPTNECVLKGGVQSCVP